MMIPERQLRLAPLLGTVALFVLLFSSVLVLQFVDAAWKGGVAVVLAIVVFGSGGLMLYRMVRRLEDDEARLRGIVESASDAILTVTELGYIETVNTSTVAMFGFRPGQLQDTRFTALLSSTYEEDPESDLLLDFLRKNGLAADGRPRQVVGLRADGTPFDMDISVSAIALDDRDVFTVVLRDVTDRVQAHNALRKARDELEARVRARTADLEAAKKRLEEEAVARERTRAEREKLIEELQAALQQVKTLKGLLPICANCKKIRDDQGYWNQVEVYIGKNTDAEFSHSICPECMAELYPDLMDDH